MWNQTLPITMTKSICCAVFYFFLSLLSSSAIERNTKESAFPFISLAKYSLICFIRRVTVQRYKLICSFFFLYLDTGDPTNGTMHCTINSLSGNSLLASVILKSSKKLALVNESWKALCWKWVFWWIRKFAIYPWEITLLSWLAATIVFMTSFKIGAVVVFF